MIRQCAWCQCKLGQKPPLDDRAVTHTICPDCLVVTLRLLGLHEEPAPVTSQPFVPGSRGPRPQPHAVQ